MAGGLLPQPKQLIQDNAWNPGIAYQLYTYEPASLTPKVTYQDNALTTANTNPVLANARGEVVMYGSGAYRIILKDSLGNTIWDRDNIDALVGGSALAGASGAALVGYDDSTLDVYLRSRINLVVSSISALRALSKSKFNQAFVSGYYVAGDGGGGAYYYDAADTTTADNGGTVIVASDGGRWKLQATGAVSVKQFGAKGDYNAATLTGTNDTAAFQGAAATGLNVYVPATTKGYLLRDAVTFSQSGQRMYGDGRMKSVINIDTTFNMAASGVLVSSVSEICFADFAVLFAQPDTSTKASMTQYPAAFSAIGKPGQRILRLRVERAWNVIDWRDNCGQSSVDDFLYSFFNIGIWLDGSLDSVRLDNVHCWPTGLTANQTTLMTTDNSVIGVNVGRADDFKANGGLFYVATPFNFFSGTRANAGAVFGTIDNCDLDGFGGIVMSAGTVNVIGGFQSCATLSSVKLNQSGGVLNYSGVNFQVGANFPATAFASFMNLSGTAVCSVTGGSIYKPNDACFVNVANGKFLMSGVNIVHQMNATFLIPLIQVGGSGQVTAINNVCSPLGTGAMPFFNAVADGNHRVSQNTFFGHTISAPVGAGYYGGNCNSVAATEIYNTMLTGDLRVVRMSGTTDGSGNFSITHNVGQGQLKVLNAQAFYKGASGEARPMTISFIDGSNVSCTGGTATTRCRVTIQYSQAPDSW